jgi:ribosomal protein S18 acetylase RimI-like enzyme
VLILTAGPEHADALAELAATTFPLACPAGEPQADIDAHIATELTPARFAARLADPAQTVLVADEDGLQGYVLLVHAEPHDPEVAEALTHSPTTELSKCYVRVEHHGSGLATALLAAALEVTSTPGMWLGVSSLNFRAQGFYGKQGFTAVGHKNFTVGSQTYRDVVMERAVTG